MRMLPKTFAAIVCGGLLHSSALAGSLSDTQLRNIIDTYAGSAVANGQAVGVGVAIVRPGHSPVIGTFGSSSAHQGRAFSPHDQFMIASVTKIFTTNLQAQDALLGTLPLDTTLAYLSDRLELPAGSVLGNATLEELGSFTAGLPNLPAICPTTVSPACMRDNRPPIAQYGAANLLSYLQQTTTFKPAPAGYLYSDLSTGLLGLLLASKPGEALADNDVHRWYRAIQASILQPLHMTDTTLHFAESGAEAARGYQIPIFRMSVANNVVTAKLSNSVAGASAAGPYFSKPQATLEGGGGTGARVTIGWHADSDSGPYSITGVEVDNTASTGYADSIGFAFPTPSAEASPAVLDPIVGAGRITGVQIIQPGAGYPDGFDQPLTVTGGRLPGQGKDAQAVADVVNGHLVFIRIVDGGSGYVPPAHISIRPGESHPEVVPIWAPAGALKSSLADMALVAQAAIPPTKGTPSLLNHAFAMAEAARACEDGVSSLQDCPAGTSRIGLAWDVMPASANPSYPRLVSKAGGLPGYSTSVTLMPGQQIGAVVFINDLQDQPQAPGSTADPESAGLTAPRLAQTILNAVYFAEHP